MRVSAGDDGERLDRVLAAAPGVGSRAAAQRLIAAGLATVDGVPRSKNFLVRSGQLVEAEVPPPPDSTLEPEPMDLAIPFEDEHLLVVDKPAGIVTHPSKGHARGTLVHGLLAHSIAGGDSPRRPGIVHRLDKDTSGLMIVAKSEESHRLLVDMLAGHEVERTYLALVHGVFETKEGTVEAPVGRDAARRQQMSVAARGGRDAVTHFRVAESWPADSRERDRAGGYSLLEVRLETGRTHQIRVHLAAIGHPVAGDATYGRRKDTLGVGRQFLHSHRLRFGHPVTGEVIELESPLPDDLKAALDRLG
ncbi:MAG: RluA family pseudouridine synthase [Gaiellales bacterium]|nr:MAG: RluA family pseudouridine synthase [Gaiellales bacterium]